MVRVNTVVTGKQAPRDSDCPWPIASDADGNVYAVWEDWRSEQDGLQIYFRKRNFNGSWEQNDVKASMEPESFGYRFGHPSICALSGEDPQLLTSYVVEWRPTPGLSELRGNTFDQGLWGVPSYYISDDDDDREIPHAVNGWSTNIVSLCNGKAYAFWQYIVDDDVELWFNEYDDGWTPANEKAFMTMMVTIRIIPAMKTPATRKSRLLLLKINS